MILQSFFAREGGETCECLSLKRWLKTAFAEKRKMLVPAQELSFGFQQFVFWLLDPLMEYWEYSTWTRLMWVFLSSQCGLEASVRCALRHFLERWLILFTDLFHCSNKKRFCKSATAPIVIFDCKTVYEFGFSKFSIEARCFPTLGPFCCLHYVNFCCKKLVHEMFHSANLGLLRCSFSESQGCFLWLFVSTMRLMTFLCGIWVKLSNWTTIIPNY